MKKSIWYALSSLILIFLILQSFGTRIKVYEKRKEYKSQEEVINDYLKNVNLIVQERNDKGNIVKTIPNLDLYETISERYRLMESSNENEYIYIPYFKEYKIENVSVVNSFMLENHLNTYKKIENYEIPKKREVYRIYGNAILDRGKYTLDSIYEIDNYENYEETEIYLVVVDEGKGYVVDHYIEKYN